MSKRTLPSIADFEDKRITSGLKFIIGGAKYTKTGGGWVNDGEKQIDFVADATATVGEDDIAIRGFCSGFEYADEFYNSLEFKNWVERNKLQ